MSRRRRTYIVSFHGVELDSEAARIARFVRKFTSGSNGGESNEDRSLLTDTGQEVGFLQASQRSLAQIT